MMEDLIRLLHGGDHSLVVANGNVYTFNGRGVTDLYALLREDPGFLKGASIADKVVGKAAAALMILGGVKRGVCRCYQPTGYRLVRRQRGVCQLRHSRPAHH